MCAVLLYVRDMQKWTTREQEISREMKEQEIHPGELATKVGYFGSNLLKCPRGQMGT